MEVGGIFKEIAQRRAKGRVLAKEGFPERQAEFLVKVGESLLAKGASSQTARMAKGLAMCPQATRASALIAAR